MLPFSHSRRMNHQANLEPAGSLTRKSARPSLKSPDLPYNGSASYYRNSAPAIPPSSMEFRQRQRPSYLQRPTPTYLQPSSQMYGPTQNRLTVPGHPGMMGTSTYARGVNELDLMPPPPLAVPRSPGLDQVQVLTDIRPTPNVVWFCEKKREKSKFKQYKQLLVCLVLLITIGLAVYKGIDFARGVREGYKLQTDELDNGSYREKIVNVYVPDKEPIEQVEKVESVILDGRNDTETDTTVSMPIPTAKIKLVYSINEDMESTVEVIEG